MSQMTTKMEDRNLEEIEIPQEDPELDPEPELADFDDSTWIDFDWNKNWK